MPASRTRATRTTPCAPLKKLCNHKARRREQRTEVIEGGIGSEHAHGGIVRVGRRDTLDEKLGLRLLRAVEIEGEAGVFLEYMLDVREHPKATDSFALM